MYGKSYEIQWSCGNSNHSNGHLTYRAALQGPSLGCSRPKGSCLPCPRCFNILTNRPPDSFHIAQVELISTRISMTVDMPSGNSDVHLSCFGDLHMFRIFFHAFSEIFYVVGEYNAEESDEGDSGEDNEVNTAVPRMMHNEHRGKIRTSKICTFRLLRGRLHHSCVSCSGVNK